MRISDWSSDVCSSDLIVELLQPQLQALDGKFLVIDQNGADCHAFDPIFCSPPADLTRAGKVVCVAAVPAWFSALPAAISKGISISTVNPPPGVERVSKR